MILICTSYLSLPKSALNLTPFNFNIAIGYVILVLVVTNISLDLLSANLLHIDVWCLLLHLHKRQNALNLPVLFFFLLLCQSYPGLRNYKLVFLILKILQYDRLRRLEFSFFQDIHVRIDIFFSIKPMTTEFG